MTTRGLEEGAPLSRFPILTVSDFPAKGNTLTVKQIAELSVLSEAVGADRFGITDFPYYYDCIPTMVACLASTDRLVVESLVTTPYARHPETTACAFATMSDFSEGRVILGVGGGVEEPSNVWVEPWGRVRPRPLRAMRELVSICRMMWSGDQTPTSGEVLRGSGLSLKFGTRFSVPVLVAARGEQMLELAGEIADVVHIAAPFLGDSYISTALERIASGAERAGRTMDDFEIDLTVSTCLMSDAALAKSLAKITTGAAILWMSGAEKYAQQRKSWSVPQELTVPDELINELATRWDMWSGEALPTSCAQLMDDSVLNQFSVAGSAEQSANRLADIFHRYPALTGLRLKLPPLSGPDSFEQYSDMLTTLGAVKELWPVAPNASSKLSGMARISLGS